MAELELDQKIRSKNLELSKALQDVDRLTAENVELKQQKKDALEKQYAFITQLQSQIAELTMQLQSLLTIK